VKRLLLRLPRLLERSSARLLHHAQLLRALVALDSAEGPHSCSQQLQGWSQPQVCVLCVRVCVRVCVCVCVCVAHNVCVLCVCVCV
jgi:hypothetical protein